VFSWDDHNQMEKPSGYHKLGNALTLSRAALLRDKLNSVQR